jgi:2-aminoethylphosphonate-pyruvate transaminase
VFVAERWRNGGPEGQDDMPWLMGTGAVTTSRTVKAQMMADWDSRDPLFRALEDKVRYGLLALAGAGPEHEAVLVGGTPAVALEAALAALAPEGRRRKTLVLSNGGEGERMALMLDRLKRPLSVARHTETTAFDPAALDALLVEDADIACLTVPLMETASGLVNPIADIVAVARTRGRAVVVDATHGFGALPCAVAGVDAMIVAPHRCLEGVPGFAAVLVRRETLEAVRAAPPPLALDLAARLPGGTFYGRDAPPQAVAACAEAMRELEAEGGPAARLARYGRTHALLVEGMRAFGLQPLFEGDAAGPVVTAFPVPASFDFAAFDAALRRRGYVIDPGMLADSASFRVSLAGRIAERAVRGLLDAMREALPVR